MLSPGNTTSSLVRSTTKRCDFDQRLKASEQCHSLSFLASWTTEETPFLLQACRPRPNPAMCSSISFHSTSSNAEDTGNNFGPNHQDYNPAGRSDAPQPKGILQVSYIWTLNSDLVLICKTYLCQQRCFITEETDDSFPDCLWLFPIALSTVPLPVQPLLSYHCSFLPMYVCVWPSCMLCVC